MTIARLPKQKKNDLTPEGLIALAKTKGLNLALMVFVHSSGTTGAHIWLVDNVTTRDSAIQVLENVIDGIEPERLPVDAMIS